MLRKLLVLCVLASLGPWAHAAEGPIWIEGENAVRKTLVPNGPMNNVNPDALSGGKWICGWSHIGRGEPQGSAEYAVEIPAAGKYRIWARAMSGSGLAYRVDGAKEAVDVAVGRGHGVDPIPVAADGNPFWPGEALWFDCGTVELTQGKHTIVWYLGGLKGEDRFGGLDCFVLTTGTFEPHGKYKPGEKYPLPQPAFQPREAWDFSPPRDTFDSAAVLDLHGLNETTAGDHGFIRLSADGDSFVRGDGQPIRFWSSGEWVSPNQSMEFLRRQAKFLAKRGVNAIRLFRPLQPTAKDSKIGDVDERLLDALFKVHAAMKFEGIYTFPSIYWAGATPLQKGWHATDPGRNNCSGLVFFDPKFQAIYKSWMKAVYQRVNPYTGMRMADDPAVAVIQLQNEDSLLWWDLRGLQGDALKLLLRQHTDFLKKKYGSLEKARAAWQGYVGHPILVADNWAADAPGMLDPWCFTRDMVVQNAGNAGYKAHVADDMEFLAGAMRRFNQDMVKYLREELRCKQLVNANNWQTVDMVTTQDAEYWADSATDVVARNIYTGGIHVGAARGWQILPGHVYSDASMLTSPTRLATNVKHPMGHPFMWTEMLWPPPNFYQSESPLLIATQEALKNLGPGCWFSNWVEPDWERDPHVKWTHSTPVQAGQFPAAALIYRQGLVKQGEPAVVEHRSLQDIWQCRIPLIGEEPGFDPNHYAAEMPQSPHIKTVVDPLAYWVGPVREVYGSDPAKSTAVDLSKYIDRQGKTVRSITGELELDYGRGIYRVDAPAAQAICGFLRGSGEHRLADVTIACDNRYASIVVVPLDGQPIGKSGKLLVQAGTLARLTGWTVVPFRAHIEGKQGDCFRILDTGKWPLQVENLHATVTIANPRLSKATLLDANGMATATPVELTRAGGKATVVLPENTLYVVLE